jgi:regulator of replication initiation timing
MIPLFVNGKTYQISYDVNEAITAIVQESTRLRAENGKLRAELKMRQWRSTKCVQI